VVAAQVAELRLGERFCGPAATANGGYACGTIAELLSGGVEVTLRHPPRLDRRLRLRVGDGGATVHDDDGELVAEAHPATSRSPCPRRLGRHRPARAAGRADPQADPGGSCARCFGPSRPAG
jgi:hypothetical protein